MKIVITEIHENFIRVQYPEYTQDIAISQLNFHPYESQELTLNGEGELVPYFNTPQVVEHPVTEHPVTEQPVAEQPVTVQPVAVHPVTEQPVAVHPVTEQPVAVQPVTEQPVAEQPVTSSEEVTDKKVKKKKKRFFKVYIPIIVILISIIAFILSQKEGQDFINSGLEKTGLVKKETPKTETGTPSYRVGDTFELGKFKYILSNQRNIKDATGENTFSVFNLQVVSKSEDITPVLKIQGSNTSGEIFNDVLVFSADPALGAPLSPALNAPIKSGESVTGYIAFNVKDKVNKVEITDSDNNKFEIKQEA